MVEKGGPDIEDGTYRVTLAKVDGPKTITPQQGPNAGKDVVIYDWTFKLNGILDLNGDEVELQATTSPALSPKSKMFAYVTALAGGRPPAIGTAVDTDKLIGRQAFAAIARPADGGWPKITGLQALPASEMAKEIAKATGAPLKGLPAAAATAGDDLPF